MYLNWREHHTLTCCSLLATAVLSQWSITYFEQFLDISEQFLGLERLVIGFAQLNLHLFPVTLYLLLDPPCIVLAPHCRVQDALHGVDQPLLIPLDLFHLLIFLCQLPVSLLLTSMFSWSYLVLSRDFEYSRLIQ